jgi:hypothetical protein
MKYLARVAILVCILMAAVFLEVSLFFFLYDSCASCLLSISFILTYWACSSAINMVLGLSYTLLTGGMSSEKKKRAAVICTLVLVALLAVVGYAIRLNFT